MRITHLAVAVVLAGALLAYPGWGKPTYSHPTYAHPTHSHSHSKSSRHHEGDALTNDTSAVEASSPLEKYHRDTERMRQKLNQSTNAPPQVDR